MGSLLIREEKENSGSLTCFIEALVGISPSKSINLYVSNKAIHVIYRKTGEIDEVGNYVQLESLTFSEVGKESEDAQFYHSSPSKLDIEKGVEYPESGAPLRATVKIPASEDFFSDLSLHKNYIFRFDLVECGVEAKRFNCEVPLIMFEYFYNMELSESFENWMPFPPEITVLSEGNKVHLKVSQIHSNYDHPVTVEYFGTLMMETHSFFVNEKKEARIAYIDEVADTYYVEKEGRLVRKTSYERKYLAKEDFQFPMSGFMR